MIVAIQMDPIEDINPNTDTTFVLALEAQRRSYTLLYYLPQQLFLRDGEVHALVKPLSVFLDSNDYYSLGTEFDLNLATVDIILVRQDPPFDMAYITTTYFLERLHPRTLVVNNPAQIRNTPEKLFTTCFAHLMPPTLVTSDLREIFNFREEHLDIVIKPLFGNAGTCVLHLTPEDENIDVLLDMFARLYREAWMIQKYIPEVSAGDKRILLIDGKPVGAVNRIPKQGSIRANLHSGGKAMQASLSRRDYEICETIGPVLRQRGLLLVGIDVIGQYLTEINVTSPTCLQEINRFDGKILERDMWDTIELYRSKTNDHSG